MRIALFAETYIPEVNGVVAHVKTLKEGLEKLGHQVLVVAADKHCKHHYIQDGVLHCPAASVKRFYGFGMATPLSHKRQKLISEFNPDVIHIHHEFGIGLSGLIAARSQKKPLVYTLHTVYDQYIFYIAPKPLLKTATKVSHRYERFIANNAAVLTGPSQKSREYFKAIGIDRETYVIPNSADLDSFNPLKITDEQKQAFREKYNISPDKMLICFVGRLGKEKSVDVLIDYFGHTITAQDNIHLVIIGDGPDRAALELLASELGVSDIVTFTGLVKHEMMPVYFASCDAYVTASLSEMNSISMLEGMASGLPVLQRYDELNADQIDSGVNGYLYHNKEEFAEKLLEIKNLSPTALDVLKQQVIATVVSRGSSQMATYLLGLYEQAIEKNRLSIRSR